MQDEEARVRNFALEVLTKDGDQGLDTTRAAVAAVQRWGWEESFEWVHRLRNLCLDRPHAETVLTLLEASYSREWPLGMQINLAEWLCQSPGMEDPAFTQRRYNSPIARMERGEWGPPSTHAPVRRSTPKVGRNDPCPCGSGKKYKKCCGK